MEMKGGVPNGSKGFSFRCLRAGGIIDTESGEQNLGHKANNGFVS